MPLTLTAPVAGPQVASLTIRAVHIDPEGGTVSFIYEQFDVNGVRIAGFASLPMTGAAFITAFQAAAGGFKARLYAVLEGALSLTGTVT